MPPLSIPRNEPRGCVRWLQGHRDNGSKPTVDIPAVDADSRVCLEMNSSYNPDSASNGYNEATITTSSPTDQCYFLPQSFSYPMLRHEEFRRNITLHRLGF
ncbi:ras association domain-containing protein 8 [Plakobranchus ocellatus]|uniref:Ras association domain-containing protein 8 n=1 Tax=Plakobranchus ocellatus TaxID=259542 RepID=A0AAV3YZ38_9GAST|nr:ras association domain-containing protein 8 [Plakobranchus ocellatus]